jgi:hypothetical protein
VREDSTQHRWRVRTLYSVGLPSGVFGRVVSLVDAPYADSATRIASATVTRNLPSATVHAHLCERVS